MKKRANRPITDQKYHSKRRLSSIKRKLAAIGAQWEDVDMFIARYFEQEGGLLDQIDEIIAEIDGIDPDSH